MSSPIRVGLVGFGMAARVMHAPFLKVSPKYEVVAVLQRHGDEAAAYFPSARVYRSFEEVAKDPDVELVVITTPNETHFPFATLALAEGRHVVLEKPFTNTSQEAAALIRQAHERNVVLSPFHNRRYVADFLTIRNLLEDGSMGRIHEWNGRFDRYRPDPKPGWREEALPGSGVMFDLGPHLMDQVLFLFGNPKTITATIRRQRPHAKADDFFNIVLDYGFLRATLSAGMLVREPGPRYVIHGTEGSLIKYGDDPQEALLKEGALPGGPGWGAEDASLAGLLNNGEGRKTVASMPGNFGAYYDSLYDSIRNGKPLSESPAFGFNTVRLLELAQESQQYGRTVECAGLIEQPALL